jgi:SPP1 family predicted phage head-tail adaptor
MKCCDILPANLKDSFEIWARTSTAIGGGAVEKGWAFVARGQGDFKPLSGAEAFYAMRTDATTKNKIVMRYRTDLKESQKLKINGRFFNIRFIKNIENKNRFLEIDLDGGGAL